MKSEFKFSQTFLTTAWTGKRGIGSYTVQQFFRLHLYTCSIQFVFTSHFCSIYSSSTDRMLQVEPTLTLLIVQTVCKLCKKSNLIE